MKIVPLRVASLATFVALVVAGCATTTTSQVLPETPAERFMKRYQHLSDTYDPAIAELYADDAVLKTSYTRMSGEIVEMSFTGAQYKELVPKVSPLAKARQDRSELKDLRYEAIEGGVRVRATKVSISKCYEDSGFILDLRNDGAGGFVIVGNFSNTQSRNMCPDRDPVPMMQPLLQQVAGKLPLRLDENTRLDDLKADPLSLTYSYTLFGVNEAEFNVAAFSDGAAPGLLKQACVTPIFRSILDNGAKLVYVYRYESGTELTTLAIAEGNCP